MTEPTLVDLLGRTFVEILAEFASVTAQAGDLPAHATGGWEARMDLYTPVGLTVWARAPASLCRQLAAGILEMPCAEVTQAVAADAFKESLNIVAGRLAWKLGGDTVPVEMSVPLVLWGRVGQLALDPASPDVVLRVGSMWLMAGLVPLD